MISFVVSAACLLSLSLATTPCENPVAPPHGHIQPLQPQYFFTDSFNLMCEKGYKLLQGEEYLTFYQAVCQKDGRWDSPMPTCSPVNCGPPDEISNGKASYTTVTYQSSMQYTCNNPFYVMKNGSNGTYICDHKLSWIDSLGRDTPPECVPTCGKPQSGKLARVIGGEKADKNDIPWQVLVEVGGISGGGTLISDDWVLTSAHVLRGYGDVSNIRVKMGMVWRNDTGAVTNVPAAVFLHPQYRHDKVNLDHDIALIQLSRKVTVNAAVMPVCLPQSDERFLLQMDDFGRVSGWGTWWQARRRIVITLRFATLLVVDFELCKDAYEALRFKDGRPLVFTGNMICAGIPLGGKDACRGDSGGPFVFYDDISRAWFIGGVVSWGQECAMPGMFGVYTKVSNYISWIEDVMEANPTVPCVHPVAPPHGRIQPLQPQYFFTDSFNLTCEKGYELLQGEEYLTFYRAVCQKDGRWDSPMLTCSSVNCGPPAEISNGKASYTTVTYQSFMQYTCNDPFYVMKNGSNGTYICDHKGSWIDSLGRDTPPECVPSTTPCEHPVAPPHGHIQPLQPQYFFTDSFNLTCEKGYKLLQGEEYLTFYRAVCQKDGSWESPMPTCSPVNCGPPDEISNGKASYTTVTYQSSMQYTCNDPFYVMKNGSNGTYICDHTGSWIDSLGRDNPPECVPTCGKTQSDKLARVIGSEKAAKNDIPWQVLVLGGGRFIGGGTLISDDWVLTSAHVLWGYGDASNVQVKMGMVWRNDPGAVTDVPVAVFLHPQYRHDGVNFNHDIALIQLSRKVLVSAAVMPVCLPQRDERFLIRTDDLGWVSGWMVFQQTRFRVLPELHYAKLLVKDFERCRDAYGAVRVGGGRSLVVTDNMICAGVPEGGKDACEGDGGGPFVFYDDVSRAWFIGGVVSWGYECAKPGLFGVYTKVSNYISWIEEVMEANC